MLNIPLHVLLVHFPVALAVIAAVYDLRAHFKNRPELHRTGYALCLWSAAGAAAALASGLPLLGGLNQASRATVHAAVGLVSGLALIALAMMRYSAQARESEDGDASPAPWLILEVLAAVAVLVAAVSGHRLVLGF